MIAAELRDWKGERTLAQHVRDNLPSDAAGLLAACNGVTAITPRIYRCKVCPNPKCNRVKCGDMGAAARCACRSAWAEDLTVDFMSIGDALHSLFACPPVAEEMRHELTRRPDEYIRDIYDKPLWAHGWAAGLEPDGRRDVRHAKLMAFYDGLKMNVLDKHSPSLKVMACMLLNLPPHLRSSLGFLILNFVAPVCTVADANKGIHKGLRVFKWVIKVVTDEIIVLSKVRGGRCL